ncbi:heterodisulfide reductase-related iron-sulfur binding cluster [Deltaproteobacteria bacterium]|nr:heterodisulfide reductase-related iron-sulfur binding cluster [Deltaproteobacteria bacterium]
MGRRIFKRDLTAGLMHVFIMWGFIGLFVGTVLSTTDYWLIHFLSGDIYLVYSFCLEILGLMLIVGLFMALIRRYIAKVSRLNNRFQDLWILILLLACVLTGFLVEGIRLAVQRPEWGGYSFAGLVFSSLLSSKDQATALYSFMWWLHVLISFFLIAYFPFSKLFHSFAAPFNIYLAVQPAPVISTEDRSSEELEFPFRDMINFSACTGCGRCNEVCPSTSAMEPFSPREFIVQANEYIKSKNNPLNRIKWFHERFLKGISEKTKISPEQIWYCTTCRACLEVCPVCIGAFEPIRRVRIAEIEEGSSVPSLLIKSLETLYMYDNPWERSKKKRDEWSDNLNVLDLTKGERADICYFVGCTTSIDTRARDLAKEFVTIMNYAGINFGTLGQKETCCGDIARRVGEDGLFEEQMEKTLELFAGYGISEVVTSSPHCFNVFKNEYPGYQDLKTPEERVSFRVRHYTQLLAELMDRGLIRPVKSLDLKVTYHDPCYLGRYNHIYEEPRRIIKSIPGVKLLEMAHFGTDSLCCGGGGGRMWQELEDEKKLSEIRIREAAETGASVLVTACPYCLIMLEDALKTADLEDKLRVMDLNELLTEALGLGDNEE